MTNLFDALWKTNKTYYDSDRSMFNFDNVCDRKTCTHPLYSRSVQRY